MSDRRKAALSWALLGGAALCLTAGASSIGCRGRSRPQGTRVEGESTPVRGGTLRLASGSDLGRLDPATSFDTETQPYVALIFAALLDYDRNGELVGDLAERWEVADDGKTYRFFLRHGVAMHDGSELTAEDVKRTAERTFHPDTPCPAIAFFDRLSGLADYQAGKADHLSGVVVESSHVVAFHLDKPDATFLQLLPLGFLRPVCKNAGNRYDPEYQSKLCGAGPFKLDTVEPGKLLRLTRFDRYHQSGRPYLDAIELREAVPVLTQRFQLERGELDFVNQFTRPDFFYFRGHPEWSKYGVARVENSTYGELLNVEMKPFDDVRVRRACGAALNRPHLQQYYEGISHVTGRLLPPGMPGRDESYVGQVYDLEKARALMAEAGYPYDPATGKGGYPETIPYLTSEFDSAIRIAQLLQYDLAQIGIRLEIRVVSVSVYYALSGRPKNTAIGFTGWNADFPDPSDFFEPIFTRRSIAPEDSQNHSFYANDALDALLDRAHSELDAGKRRAMYAEAERIVVEDAPWIFAYNPMRYDLTQPWVRGYSAHPIWNIYLHDVWLDPRSKLASRALLGPGRLGSALGSLLSAPGGGKARWP
jgi:ABC-type transport system substrate-binding protein